MLTQMQKYRSQNLNIYVKFHLEFEVQIQNIQLLHLDRKISQKRPAKNMFEFVRTVRQCDKKGSNFIQGLEMS